MKVAEYFATGTIRLDQSSVSKFNTQLNNMEARLKKLDKLMQKPISLNVNNFTVDDNKLRSVLKMSLDAASPRVAFDISKFVVNDRNLTAALLRAARRQRDLLPPPGPNPHPPHPGPYPPYPPAPRPGSNAAARGGMYYGGLGGLWGPAIGLGLGGYGLSALNKRNQEVVSAQLQSSAVVQQAGGTTEQGKDSFEWLRKQADRVGFNYLDAAPDYNKLLSGLTGAGMSIQQGQNVYKGFAELSRVNKLDRVQQQRVFRALSQVAGKNRLMSEELTGQLARHIWPLIV